MFRTLYCAESPLTSLRETLSQFRPSVAARRDFARFGRPTWPDVTLEWRQQNVLVSAEIEISSGSLLSLGDPGLLVSLEVELADLLLDLRIENLTLGEIQGKNRQLTQAIARAVFGRGAAGVVFPSQFDGRWCAGLFEGKARLLGRSAPQSLVEEQPEFREVCGEYGLHPSSLLPLIISEECVRRRCPERASWRRLGQLICSPQSRSREVQPQDYPRRYSRGSRSANAPLLGPPYLVHEEILWPISS